VKPYHLIFALIAAACAMAWGLSKADSSLSGVGKALDQHTESQAQLTVEAWEWCQARSNCKVSPRDIERYLRAKKTLNEEYLRPGVVQ